MNFVHRTCVILSASWLVGILCLTPAYGCQSFAEKRLAALTVTVKALSGQPFGVGIVTVTETHRESWWGPPDPVDFQILSADAFYPVVERTGSPAGQSHKSDELRIYFLFDVQSAETISSLERRINWNQSVIRSHIGRH